MVQNLGFRSGGLSFRAYGVGFVAQGFEVSR